MIEVGRVKIIYRVKKLFCHTFEFLIFTYLHFISTDYMVCDFMDTGMN